MYPRKPYKFNPCTPCIPWYPPMPTPIMPPVPMPKPPTQTPIPEPPVSPAPMPVPTGFYYTVQYGDTIYLIAQRFNVPMNDIIAANNIPAPYVIYPGQRLFIPGVPAPTPPPGGRIYIVQPGDTLYEIAQRFNTTVEAIARLNNINNPDLIYPGQRLIIPGAGTPIPPIYPVLRRGNRGYYVTLLQEKLLRAGFNPGPIDGIFGARTEAAVKEFQENAGLSVTGIVDEATWEALLGATPTPPSEPFEYTVQPGDTLYLIAQRFNTTIEAIVAANDIENPALIYPGQIIIIPVD